MTTARPHPVPRHVRRARPRGAAVLPPEASDRWQSRRAAAWTACCVALLLAGFGVVLGRVVQLQTAPDPRIAESVQGRSSTRLEPGHRGALVDRAGRPLAVTIDGWRVFVDPHVALERGAIDTIAMDLAEHLEVDPVELDRPLQDAFRARPGTRFVPLTDPLPTERVASIRRAILAGDLPGAGLEPRPIRVRPAGELGATIVGAVGFEHQGQTGAESGFDGLLQPTHGRLVYRRDVRRRALWVQPGDYAAAAAGDDIRLSIDLEIQRIAEDRLVRAVHEHHALGGRIVVVDPRSGELLALADMIQARDDMDPLIEDHQKLLELPPALRWSRCATDPYEPGSTFKPFIWAVATELGRATPDEELPTPSGYGWRDTNGRIIRDAHYYGPSTWRKVLVKSMNTGMAMVAGRMSHAEMQAAVSRFGFGERTRVGLQGETAGIMTSPKAWNSYSQSSVAMGHEIAVTPLQMVQAFSAFARDGTMPVLRLTAADESRRDGWPARRVLLPETARLTREIMHAVTVEGTGRAAVSNLYRSFGKSGTAQLPKPGGYHEDRYTSSYIAGAPLDEPRVVVLCVIDDPDRRVGPYYGGKIAGPVVRDVYEAALKHLGVPPDQPEPGALAPNVDLLVFDDLTPRATDADGRPLTGVEPVDGPRPGTVDRYAAPMP